jgi:hypothetical protein
MEIALARALSVPQSRPRVGRALMGVAILVFALTGGAGATWAWRAWRGSVPVVPFAARDWVLVASFENRSGNAAFDDVLGPALVRELLGSGSVNVVPRARVEDTLELMQKPLDARLDAGLAREVSVRAGGIKALIAGRIDKIGAAYVLTADIVNPADGVVRASISEQVTAVETLLASVQRQALRLYTEAAALMDGEAWLHSPDPRSRYATAEALLRRATEADPAFASAWLLLAQTVRAQSRSIAEALALAERAMGESVRSTAAERCFIEGVWGRTFVISFDDLIFAVVFHWRV